MQLSVTITKSSHQRVAAKGLILIQHCLVSVLHCEGLMFHPGSALYSLVWPGNWTECLALRRAQKACQTRKPLGVHMKDVQLEGKEQKSKFLQLPWQNEQLIYSLLHGCGQRRKDHVH